MAATRNRSFPAVEDPVELRRYLLELQLELDRLSGSVTQLSPVVTTARYAANYGEVIRVDPPTDGTTIVLPAPTIARAGQTVTLMVVGDGGQITLEVVQGQVNNAESFTFQAGVGDVVCRLDGPRGWFIPSAELSGSGPVDAEYYVGATDASLPNARLGTASTEITPDHGTANVVSWALNVASVVFAKLQDLTGLSVLGRAANSTGVMAAITASSARQVLQANDAGTSLAWGDPLEVQEEGTDQGDAYAINVEAGNAISGYAEIASRVATLHFDINHARTLVEDRSGTLDTSDASYNYANFDVVFFTNGVDEISNIPVPLDANGNVTNKQLVFIGGLSLSRLVMRHNNGGTASTRINCPDGVDTAMFRGEVLLMVYNETGNRWFCAEKYGVKARADAGTIAVGRNLDFVSTAGISWAVALFSNTDLRVTPTLADIPLSALEDIGDDQMLINITGGNAPPAARDAADFAGNGFAWNPATHSFNIGASTKIGVTTDSVAWLGMEGRIAGTDTGDFLGVDFTNASGNVVFSADTGAGSTFGVVASVDLSSVTYTSGDGLDLVSNEFAVDVSDLVGYGITDDGSNNFRLGPFGRTVDTIATSQANYSRPNNERVVRLDPSANVFLTGVDGGYEGEILFVQKAGDSNYIILSDDGGSSTAGNRFQFHDDHERQLIGENEIALFVYTGSDWQYVGSPWPFFNESGQSDRDIPIVGSGGEWGRESLNWALVLAAGNTSGSNDPHITNGRFLGFGIEGSLPASGDIRASSGLDIVSTTGNVSLANANAEIEVQSSGPIVLTPGGASPRVTIEDGPLAMDELASIPTISTNKGAVFVRQNSVTSELVYVDDDDVQRDVATWARGDHVPYVECDNFGCVYWDSTNDVVHSDTTWRSGIAANGGTVVQIETEINHHGILRLLTDGTATNDFVRIFKGSATTSDVVWFVDVDRLIFIVRPQTSTDLRWFVGLMDTVQSGMTRGVRFAQDDSTTYVGTANLSFQTSNGSTVEETSAGVAISNSWVVLEIVRNSDNSWSGFVDGALVGTHSTHVPGSGFIGNVGVMTAQNSTDAKFFDVDYYFLRHIHNSRQS